MDFALPPELEDLRARIARFVDERLIPLEADPASYDAHENIAPDVLARLREEAKREGLWALAMPKARGGGGLSRVGMAVAYEEMNRSIFGPVVFNAAAPDDGNMLLLERILPEEMKERWLQPIIDGRAQSAFAMTEPDGCGSDPSLTYTRADRVGDFMANHRSQVVHHRRGQRQDLHPRRPHLG
ncbi:MAG: acyl-CoA dehydrogenase family protein [Acetobacteraceae bacterium]|nr:acyl-CoA dehydrogenase family protein [Acetobacteraceae bacterium]